LRATGPENATTARCAVVATSWQARLNFYYGYYLGARLGGVINLTWEKVDFNIGCWVEIHLEESGKLALQLMGSETNY
jgi:hypothetical protein